MSIAAEVKDLTVGEEFHVCTVCNYDMGFHVSFQRKGEDSYQIVLICPQCGARFGIGWDISLSVP